MRTALAPAPVPLRGPHLAGAGDLPANEHNLEGARG